MIRPGPRKRRTREHVIADLSRYHVGRWFVAAGHTAEAQLADYGYDLTVRTHDPDGYIEPGPIYLQLKATDRLPPVGTDGCFAFRLDVRDVGLWTAEPNPVFLCVYDTTADVAYWCDVQHHFHADRAARPATTGKTVRVRIPTRNRVDDTFVRYARQRKLERWVKEVPEAERSTGDA